MGKKSKRTLIGLLMSLALGRVPAKGRLMRRVTTASRTFARFLAIGKIVRVVSQGRGSKKVIVSTPRAVVEVEPR